MPMDPLLMKESLNEIITEHSGDIWGMLKYLTVCKKHGMKGL